MIANPQLADEAAQVCPPGAETGTGAVLHDGVSIDEACLQARVPLAANQDLLPVSLLESSLNAQACYLAPLLPPPEA